MKQTFLLILILMSILVKAQDKNPTLKPFELDGLGEITAPDPLPETGWVIASSEMELVDIKTDFPYRLVAYFESKKLISLHVIFGENGDGLPFEIYEKIRNELIKHWDNLPTGFVKDRRKIGNKAQVWETKNYRIEWTYQNQPNSKTNKMGWLFLYNRTHFIEDYLEN
ncbi:hypothetical protein [Winogradskyella forsetii]|uniref:hypothetical protein n=1 Tax=Winogradskyella forsetii TaxID=2686077 RepID=UPI0015BEC68D|nr:hypothetical protein [Winogradskyella forsetii]